MSTTVLRHPEIDYPSSDGKPMAENDWQRLVMEYAICALRAHFDHRPGVYVSGNLLIYYEEGNVEASVAPDVFVVLGAKKQRRMVYKLWEEPKAPDFVLEVAAHGKWEEDEGPKVELYARLGVCEYFQYDPIGDLLPMRLKGRRLAGGVYEAVPVEELSYGTLMMSSWTLGLDLLAGREGDLHFRDSVTGELLPSLEEETAARREAESPRRAGGRRATGGRGAGGGAGGAPRRKKAADGSTSGRSDRPGPVDFRRYHGPVVTGTQ